MSALLPDGSAGQALDLVTLRNGDAVSGEVLRLSRGDLELDTDAMDDAAQVLVGKHDFTTFRATLCQAKSPVKTLTSLQIMQRDDDISIHARAPSFLHHQVRNIVGTLKLVGDGKWTKADVEAALAACDRTKGGPTAPARGLYLTEVIYPETTR